MTSACTMLGKTGQVGNMLGMLGMLQAKVMARQGTGRATAASVDGQSPCAASEHASEARSTLLDQAPAFVGVKVLEFLHVHESIAFSWRQQQQTRTRDRNLRPALACARTFSGDSPRAADLAVDRCDFGIVNATSGARVAFVGFPPRQPSPPAGAAARRDGTAQHEHHDLRA